MVLKENLSKLVASLLSIFVGFAIVILLVSLWLLYSISTSNTKNTTPIQSIGVLKNMEYQTTLKYCIDSSVISTTIVCNEFNMAYTLKKHWLKDELIPIYKNATEIATCEEAIEKINFCLNKDINKSKDTNTTNVVYTIKR